MYIRQGVIFSFEDALKMQAKSKLAEILYTLDWKPVVCMLEEPGKTNLGPKGYPYYALLNASVAMRLHNSDTSDFEILVPHSSSVISATLRVDTPLITISIRAWMKACSLRWYRENSSVENLPF